MLSQEQHKTLDEASLKVYLIYIEMSKKDDNASNAIADLLLLAVQAIDNVGIVDDTLPF